MRRCLLMLTALWWGACHPDPGPPPYTDDEDFSGKVTPEEPLPGPDPYIQGDVRLSLGLFYEGGASEALAIDGVAANYYIYVLEGTTTLTYSQTDSNDRIEGLISDSIVHGGHGWWGGGIVLSQARDMSTWGVMYVHLKAEQGFAEVPIAMGDESGNEVSVNATDYGYVNDGQWYQLAIPLSDFEGLDFKSITLPFSMGGPGGQSGDILLVDNL